MWCLIAFILTFFVTRTIVRYIRRNADNTAPRKWWQPRNISGAGGLHIHHVVIGVVLVLLPGSPWSPWPSTGDRRIHRRRQSFRNRRGPGAGRVRADPAPAGRVLERRTARTSVDAVFVAVAVAGLLVLGFNPLSFFDIGIWRDDDNVVARVWSSSWRC